MQPNQPGVPNSQPTVGEPPVAQPQQPLPPAQPPIQPQAVTPEPLAPQPLQPTPVGAKKSRKGLLIGLIVGGVLLVGGLTAVALIIRSRPKQYTGNYTKLVEYKPKDASKYGEYSFSYPQSMTTITEKEDEVSLQQKVLPKQILKTEAGWESRIQFSVRDAELKKLLKSLDIKYTTRDLAELEKEDIEKAGMSEVQAQARDDLSSKDEPRLVFDYQYKDKSGTLVKGRRIFLANDTAVFRLRLEAIDKIWDNQSAWEQISKDFHVN